MKNKFKVTGHVKYLDFEGGFWGIIGDDGKEYRPVQMPNQLKHDGEAVEITVRPVEEGMSIHMWGEPVKIVSFHTIG